MKTFRGTASPAIALHVQLTRQGMPRASASRELFCSREKARRAYGRGRRERWACHLPKRERYRALTRTKARAESFLPAREAQALLHRP